MKRIFKKILYPNRPLMLLNGNEIAMSGSTQAWKEMRVLETDSVSRAISLRDQGHIDLAAINLVDLLQVSPDHLQAWIELMLINLEWRDGFEDAVMLGRHAPVAGREDARVQLLLAVLRARQQGVVQAASAICDVNVPALSCHPNFELMWLNEFIRLTSVMSEIARVNFDVTKDETFRHGYVLALSALIGRVFPKVSRVDLGMRLVRELAFSARVDFLFDIMKVVIEGLPDDASLDAQAVSIAFAAAFQNVELLDLLSERWLPNDRLIATPLVQRFGAILPEHSRIIIREHDAGHRSDDFRAVKVHARALTLAGNEADANALPRTYASFSTPASYPERVFFGLFGQLRFAASVLPSLSEFLRKDAAVHGLGERVSFSLSSWDRQGQRLLRSAENVSFALDRVPPEVRACLNDKGLQTVKDLEQILPLTTELLRQSSHHTGVIRAEDLTTELGWSGSVHLGEPDALLESLEPLARQRFDQDGYFANQVRMWNRVSRLRTLLHEEETRLGSKIDWIVLLRADLKLLSGSVVKNIIELASRGEHNVAAFDFDPMALFIEGLGDRVMICSRYAAERLFAGYDMINHIYKKDGVVHKDYARDVQGHTFPGTLMYEHGTKIVQIMPKDLSFEIYRGGISLETLEDCLRGDAQALGGELGISILKVLDSRKAP